MDHQTWFLENISPYLKDLEGLGAGGIGTLGVLIHQIKADGGSTPRDDDEFGHRFNWPVSDVTKYTDLLIAKNKIVQKDGELFLVEVGSESNGART